MKYQLIFLLLCIFCIGNVAGYNIPSSAIRNCYSDMYGSNTNNLFIDATQQATIEIDGKFVSNMVPCDRPASDIGGYGSHELILHTVMGDFWSGTFSICPNKITSIYVDTDYTHYDNNGNLITVTINANVRKLGTIKPGNAMGVGSTTTVTTTPGVTVPVTVLATTQTPVSSPTPSSDSPLGPDNGQNGDTTRDAVQNTGGQFPTGTGSLSVTTTPAGAMIFLDGVQRAVSPATIPGLGPGDHTLLLKLDGYSDLSTPVLITIGQTQTYTTGLSPAAKTSADPVLTKSPGFAFVLALVALGAIVVVKKKLE